MTGIDPPLAWKVLLIGGHSGTGKTIVSRRIARRFGVGLAEVDDFRLILERMTTPRQQPELHNLLRIVSDPDASPESACEALVRVGKTLSFALEIVVANHVATNIPLILEGDGILPSFAALDVYAGRDAENAVRSVFLIETDEEQLFKNAARRKRGFEDLSFTLQRQGIRRSWLFGQWLRDEAARFGMNVVASQPWETLEERIVQAVE